MDGVDDSYIWQRRIAHGIRYQKGEVPFPESVEIGLEFNAALERKEKLDQSLLTNGVMLEICQFAKTVTRSEKYFLFEMLEFNFDLGFDINNDSLCYAYAVRVHNKIKHLKEQIKLKPHRWKEKFQLPDPSVLSGSKADEVLGRYCPKWNKIADSSVLTDASNSQSADNHRAETTGVASNTYTVKKQGGIRLRQTQSANPFCTQLGVTLAVRPDQTPQQKLDPSLLTNGVMIELLDFSRVLCGKHTFIVYELVKQNFGYAFNKPQFRMYLNRVLERKYTCLTAEDKDAFRKELFKVPAEKKKWEYKGKKRKTPEADDQELETQSLASNKRETRRQRANISEELLQDGDLSYMCPVDFETEMESGVEAEPENVKTESCSSAAEGEISLLQDVKLEEEEVFISPVQPPNDGHKFYSSNTQTKHANPKPYWCLFSEGRCAETEKQSLWLRRAARAKQILTSSRVNDMFAHCRQIGLDFNVCSGTQRHMDHQLLTNWVMWEIFKFATALSRSVRSFLFEILFNNFSLTLQDEQHERNFLIYMMAKHKTLVNHPKSVNIEFLSKPFKFPEIYHMVDVTSSFQTQLEEPSEGQEDLGSSDSAKGTEQHPFCKKLGLDLWSTEERPLNQKLDLTVLTTGAVLEIFSFVRELCGEARNTVNDILEHNFDLDLQSAETEAAQVIQRWYTTQKSLMKKQSISPKINRWLNMVVPLNGRVQQSPESPAKIVVPDLDKEELDREPESFCGHAKSFDYQNCKEIGLDLDLGSKSETKTKLDLQVLTRGVLFELHHYVQQNCNRYVPALYEILEYNFDLSAHSHRKVELAWSIASQVLAMTGKQHRGGGYLNTVFELPYEASDFPKSPQVVCKEELKEDGFTEPDLNIDNDDIVFVRKLKPVDIEVEID
ncbi:uncharacterized protein LOC115791566 [Archocentrus centrarchus]|uniref:uncharacterized protein LOC115791566 n=1 Tax=Archocentrus centrarchus TaxID=63155 RepID=UPI0011EA0CDE|nr:uncharacterized protein LOC115791566 [Archocentrus centrarchus]